MFGKRNRNPLAWGRRDKTSPDSPPISSAESLPSSFHGNDAPLFATPTVGDKQRRTWDEKPTKSDPTQRLLTALGRFQRQVLKGKEGAPQAQWSDECMSYLIQGVEIALEQGWTDVVEALTETGRILQSYEDAGAANQCAPFLADSYEILCLMVGDLIVDKVRSGIIRKWRDRYEAALDELTKAGLSLVKDDEEDGSRKKPAPVPQERVNVAPPVVTPLAPPVAPKAEKPAPAEREFSSLGALPPLILNRKPTPIPQAPLPKQKPLEADMFAGLDEIPAEEFEPAASEFVEIPELPDEPSAAEPEVVTADLAPIVNETPAPPEQVVETEVRLPADIAELLDTLCDGLARIQHDPHGSLSTVFLAMDDGLTTLEQRARELGWWGAVRACERMIQLCAGMNARRAAPDDKFFELAYGFGGVYDEAKDRSGDTALVAWDKECRTLLDTWVTDAEPNLAEPTTPREKITMNEEELPLLNAIAQTSTTSASLARAANNSLDDDESATDLLETARSAVAGGSIAEAKYFAMRAAVSIAKKEVMETESRVRLAESKHQECGRAIEQARELVQQSESEVAGADARVAEGNENLTERTRHCAGVQGSLDSIQTRIEDLEVKLRELHEQLEEAQRQRTATETALEEAKAQETGAISNLESLKEDEKGARIKLEDARQQVKTYQRKLVEIESAMEKGRELLTLRRASVAEIEQTIEQVRSAETTDSSDTDRLLF